MRNFQEVWLRGLPAAAFLSKSLDVERAKKGGGFVCALKNGKVEGCHPGLRQLAASEAFRRTQSRQSGVFVFYDAETREKQGGCTGTDVSSDLGKMSGQG